MVWIGVCISIPIYRFLDEEACSEASIQIPQIHAARGGASFVVQLSVEDDYDYVGRLW
jgi:hypothetical protein